MKEECGELSSPRVWNKETSDWDKVLNSRSTRELKTRLGHYVNTHGMDRRFIITELNKRWGDWYPSEWAKKEVGNSATDTQ